MDGITTLILMAGGMLLIVGLITILGRRYDPSTASMTAPWDMDNTVLPGGPRSMRSGGHISISPSLRTPGGKKHSRETNPQQMENRCPRASLSGAKVAQPQRPLWIRTMFMC